MSDGLTLLLFGLWSLVMILLVGICLAGCSGNEAPKSLLRQGQFAEQVFLGEKIFCVWAEERPCGLTLRNCTDGREHRCASDIAIVDLTQGASTPPGQ